MSGIHEKNRPRMKFTTAAILVICLGCMALADNEPTKSTEQSSANQATAAEQTANVVLEVQSILAEMNNLLASFAVKQQSPEAKQSQSAESTAENPATTTPKSETAPLPIKYVVQISGLMNLLSNASASTAATTTTAATEREESYLGKMWIFALLFIIFFATGKIATTLLNSINAINPFGKRKADALKAKQGILARLQQNGSRLKIPTDMNEYEDMILQGLTLPEDINVELTDVGGLEEIKDAVYETFILPLRRPDLFQSAQPNNSEDSNTSNKKGKPSNSKPSSSNNLSSDCKDSKNNTSTNAKPSNSTQSTQSTKAKTTSASLLVAPRGVLFFGPPGTGKTLCAKVIAKESGAAFLNVHMSTLMDKYFGESQKLVRAVFSLAQKLAPCIVFIDEIDAFLRERQKGDYFMASEMQSEFMLLWDGLLTERNNGVIVLGATNRPNDMDPAILRRMPRQFYFALPDLRSRLSILRVTLKDQVLDSSVDLERLAELTDRYSGSDLRALCECAARAPVREVVREEKRREDARKARELAAERKATAASQQPANELSIFPNELESKAETKTSDVQTPTISLAPSAALNSDSTTTTGETTEAAQMRALRHSDFIDAMREVQPTGQIAERYEIAQRAERLQRDRGVNSNVAGLLRQMRPGTANSPANSNNARDFGNFVPSGNLHANNNSASTATSSLSLDRHPVSTSPNQHFSPSANLSLNSIASNGISSNSPLGNGIHNNAFTPTAQDANMQMQMLSWLGLMQLAAMQQQAQAQQSQQPAQLQQNQQNLPIAPLPTDQTQSQLNAAVSNSSDVQQSQVVADQAQAQHESSSTATDRE